MKVVYHQTEKQEQPKTEAAPSREVKHGLIPIDLNLNQCKLLVNETLNHLERVGLKGFSISEALYEQEEIPLEILQPFLNDIKIGMADKIYGYTFSLRHENALLYHRFAVFNLNPTIVENLKKENKNLILAVPLQLMQQLWFTIIMDIMIAGFHQQLNSYLEDVANTTTPASTDLPG